MKKLIFIQLFIVVLLSSCLVGKRYSRPAMAVPEKYINRDSMAAVAATDTTVNLQWFKLFGDTVLNSLIQQALDTNTNLRIAALRVEQSRLTYLNSKADIWPSFGYSATGQMVSPKSTTSNFDILGTASWELDFWGKLRHAKRASYAELIASDEGLKTVKTTLVSDVANLYFLMRDLDNRIDVSRQTLKSRQLYYEIVNQRFLKGESAELDKLQAEQQLALVEASLSSLQRELEITERSMNVLLAQNPQPVPRGLQNAEQVIIPDIPAGLPSTLLEKRPDVVVCDLIMPGMGGVSTCMTIRKIAAGNEPIIALLTSMFKGAPRLLEAPEMGAKIHIPKSTPPLNVVVLIEQLLHRQNDDFSSAA